jgi:hypothetical protein
MALLYMNNPFPLIDLDLWVHPNSKKYGQQLPSSSFFAKHKADSETKLFPYYLAFTSSRLLRQKETNPKSFH